MMETKSAADNFGGVNATEVLAKQRFEKLLEENKQRKLAVAAGVGFAVAGK